MAALPQLTKDHGKLVITVALTGNLNTKERNPSLPCTPQEIADQVHNCAQLGATVFHIHARDENNKPTMHVPVFREICRLVKQRDPDVIIQISTGGRAGGGHNWRIDPLNLLPEMGSFTTGTVNLGAIVYENSPKLIEDLAQKYKETGIKPQIEVSIRVVRRIRLPHSPLVALRLDGRSLTHQSCRTHASFKRRASSQGRWISAS